jgi:two-component system response regulator AtoC
MVFQKKSPIRLLVVDDDEYIRELLTGFFQTTGYDVVCKANGQEGLQAFKDNHFDAVISDLKMSPMDGLELLTAIKNLDPKAVFIIITGYPSIETAMDAIKKGANDYINKPFQLDEINLKLQRAFLESSLKGRLKNIEWIVWALLISIPLWLVLGIVLVRLLK